MRWFPWCTSEYVMSFCKAKAAELRAEGHEVRVDHKGRHLAGDGTYQSFGKIFIKVDY